ncbi:carbohydrate sulfotransferase 15-like isoform X2 [Mercenaria mercenaria]|uniref:carbohydrate sulfotransferase 15-like isoform X2 n=1 Tax=Mercenaria mercenaria TaxID=6596 RepID=UPI00234F53A7|nr:carbohydrate sulfotransferase 15-like isoform X2 [Mercenaria mercenaria]
MQPEFLLPIIFFTFASAGISLKVLHVVPNGEEQIYLKLGDKINSVFLPNYKNPCWYEETDNNKTPQIKCLPFFYIIGAPKCGTTDLHTRLVAHPLISRKVVKEPHWINRERYISGHELSNYLQLFNKAVQEDIVNLKKQNGYHPAIFGDCSASTSWDIRLMLKENRYLGFTEPPYTNAEIIKNMNPFSKVILILRNPTQRLYSDYIYFGKGENAYNFHHSALAAVKNITLCLKKYSLRHCTYLDLPKKARLHIGIYHVFIEDFMRVFTRDRIHVLKLEEYSENPVKYLDEVFLFLDLDRNYSTRNDLTQLYMNRTSIANRRKEIAPHAGDILQETKLILDDFYRPYNERLVTLLGNKFNYNSNTE